MVSPSSIAFSSDTDGGDLSAQDTDHDTAPVLEIDAKDVVKVEVEEVLSKYSPTVKLTRISNTSSEVIVKNEKDTITNDVEEKPDKKKRGRKPGKGASKNIPKKRVAIVTNESTSKATIEKQDESTPRNRPLKKTKPTETPEIGSFDSSCFLNTPKGLVDSLSRYFTPGTFLKTKLLISDHF